MAIDEKSLSRFHNSEGFGLLMFIGVSLMVGGAIALAQLGSAFGSEVWQFTLIGVGCGGVGALLVVLAQRLRLRRPRFRLLEERAGDIVWAYTAVGTRSGRVLVTIALSDRRTEILRVNGPVIAKELLADVSQRCSRAVIGYSEERRKAYAANPQAVS